MSGLTQRMRKSLAEATRLCASGTPEKTIEVRAHDYRALHRILYGCFCREEACKSAQAMQKEEVMQ